ncbi:LysR family transcriptional regulator substrate-binding protein [Paenibacillus sp. NPDC055715]
MARRTEGHGLYETVICKFQEHHLIPRVVLDCPEISTIFSLVSTGMGITIIPDAGLGQEYGNRFRTLSIKKPFPFTRPAVEWRKDVIYPIQLANWLNSYKLETRKRLLPSRCSTALLMRQPYAG